jgi:hypothetical protein
LAPTGRSIGYPLASIASAHSLRSTDPMERYAMRRYHMRTNGDSATISSPPALRTMLFLKGEGMLGSYPNLPTLGYLGVSSLMYAAILFE